MPNSTASIPQIVLNEQIRLLYGQAPVAILSGLLAGGVGAMALWPVAEHSVLLLWFFALLAWSGIRYRIVQQFRKFSPQHKDLRHWRELFVNTSLLAGLMWGAFALLFDPTWEAGYQVILWVIFTGVIGGSLNSYAIVLPVFVAFFVPLLSIIVSVLLYQGTLVYTLLAALHVAYGATMFLSARRYSRGLADALTLRYENAHLADRLSRANAQLVVQSTLDPLTNIANRRLFDERLENEWNRHQRSGRPLSLLLIDVDCFKQYNDYYGHDGGDHCLTRIADTLSGHLKRAGDLVARYGGEEFVALLSETSLEEAMKHAEAMRRNIESLGITHADSVAADVVTVSIGVASAVPVAKVSGADLLKAADVALYEAKGEGRNRIASHEVGGYVRLETQRSPNDKPA